MPDGPTKRLKLWAGIWLGVFAISGCLIFFFSEQLSKSMGLTYLVLGMAGISMLVAPILVVKAWPDWSRRYFG